MDLQDPHEPEPTPPTPDADDEVDVDLGDDLQADTNKESIEFVGEAETLEAYFRSQLEDFIDPSIPWMLDCIDWRRVQWVMEAGRYRYVLEQGGVYRCGIPASRDPAGPLWIGRA